jgi:hypothetical protein
MLSFFRKFRRQFSVILTCLFVSGCAGWGRSCSSWQAENFGTDWIVVQYRMDGAPINCWVLHSTSITNEDKSDGIYWKDPTSGHLVHISGWYNRIQVDSGNFQQAANLLGIEIQACVNGKYGKNVS